MAGHNAARAVRGYTAGLAATGEALGLPQDKRKLSTGSALIRTFCVPRKPTARNPSTRVRPAAEPEKWRLFKEYNAQDVVTEQEIERRLSVWPVPDAVQKQWETDILINARGVAVDLDLVHGALACSARVTQELTQEAVQISGLDNPNSVAQLSRWLEDETGAEVADLRKDTVPGCWRTARPQRRCSACWRSARSLARPATKSMRPWTPVRAKADACAACCSSTVRTARGGGPAGWCRCRIFPGRIFPASSSPANV